MHADPDQPSYHDAEALTGLPDPDPVLTVRHAGTMPTRPVPARSGITGQVSLPDTSAHQLIGRNLARRSALILNTGSTTVYIGFDQNTTTTNGFPILAGAAVTIDTADEVWMIGTAGGSVAYLSQHEDGH